MNLSCLFTVTPTPGLSLSVSSASGTLGATLPLTATGTNTNRVQGTTMASLISNSLPTTSLPVNRIDQVTATSANLNVTIPSNAPLGAYTLTLQTGGQVTTTPFTVAGCYPSLSIAPTNGMPGQTLSTLPRRRASIRSP